MNEPSNRARTREAGLLLKFGGSGQPWRPLERDVMVIGRVQHCDLVLNAPEISQIHCVLSRHLDGWWIRDCGSRAGTRVNGKRILESRLNHGDILQLAVFSFEAYLPGSSPDGGPSSVRMPIIPHAMEKLLKSRRRLIRLALGYRQRMLDHWRRYVEQAPSLQEREEQLRQQEAHIQTKVRECAVRSFNLEQAERELAVDRETLEHEYAQLQENADQMEHNSSCRQAEAAADVNGRRRDKEVEQRRRENAGAGQA